MHQKVPQCIHVGNQGGRSSYCINSTAAVVCVGGWNGGWVVVVGSWWWRKGWGCNEQIKLISIHQGLISGMMIERGGERERAGEEESLQGKWES